MYDDSLESHALTERRAEELAGCPILCKYNNLDFTLFKVMTGWRKCRIGDINWVANMIAFNTFVAQ